VEGAQVVRAVAPDRARPLRESGLYVLGLRAGLQLLRARRLKRGLRYLVMPIGYWRCVEFQLVWDNTSFRRDDRILDIGSPKLLSVYLAQQIGAEVYASDIDDYFLDEFGLIKAAMGIPDRNLRLEVQDGRSLTYPDNAFDKVYSVSVIEHIPEHGDSECLREIGRVLRPGGEALITVPYWPTSKDEYRSPNFYWAGASVTRADGKVFFQRRYSLDDLSTRLIKPSGLQLSKLAFVGERVLTHARHEFCEFLPPPTGPIHPILSRLVHTRPVPSPDQLKKPLCAFLKLTKA
jgi:SAM-dependent methyltransferase